MPLINKSIANLFNGISQQPPSLRLPTQGDVQENFHSSVVEGLRKRPPSKHIAKITSDTSSTSYIHTINRDSTERYVVVVTNGDLKVFNLAGTAMTVNFPNGKAYLTNTNPIQGFSLLSVADYTFVVNKSVATAMTTATSAGTLKGSIAQYSDTVNITTKVAGDTYRVVGDPNNASNKFGDYYVYWSGSAWEEWSPPGTLTTFDNTTMPWALTRVATNTFTFAPITWNQRLVASTGVNPLPSFLGKTITDIFFHRNRLGFISGENIIFSRSGSFFNFWRKTSTAVLDDDPIDVSVTHTKVATLRFAISFNTNLLLFSDKSQFQLSARDLLTPRTINVTATTEYDTSNLAKPTAIGQDVYFCVDKGGYSSFKEYYVAPLTYTFDATDITAHVPKYIPTGTFSMIGSSTEDCMWTLNSTERNAIYVYKFYWGDKDTKVQSSWAKWVFDAQDTILSIDTVGTVLYLCVRRADGLYLESIDMQAASVDGLGVLVHLDRKTSLTGAYNSGTGLTTWTLPYADTATNFQIVLGEGFGTRAGTVVIPTRPTSSTMTAIGDYSTAACYIGRTYVSKYRFSEQFYKDKEKVSVTHSQIKMKNIQVQYTNTGYFRAEVTPKYRGTYSYTFTGQTVSGLNWTLGSISIGSGVANIPLFVDSQFVTIDLINDSYLPSYFQSAEWEAELSTRSVRM